MSQLRGDWRQTLQPKISDHFRKAVRPTAAGMETAHPAIKLHPEPRCKQKFKKPLSIIMPSFNSQETNQQNTISISPQAAYDAALAAKELANANYREALAKYKEIHAELTLNDNNLNASYNAYETYSENLQNGISAYNNLYQESIGTLYQITESKYPGPFNAPVKNFKFMEYFLLITTNPNLLKNGEKLQKQRDSILDYEKGISKSKSNITLLIENNKILKEALDEQRAVVEKAKADLELADANLAAAQAALDEEKSAEETDVFSTAEPLSINDQDLSCVNDPETAAQEQAIITGQSPLDKFHLAE